MSLFGSVGVLLFLVLSHVVSTLTLGVAASKVWERRQVQQKSLWRSLLEQQSFRATIEKEILMSQGKNPYFMKIICIYSRDITSIRLYTVPLSTF